MPKFSLAALMMFTGYNMIAGLDHVSHYGAYVLVLVLLTAGLVYQIGIFKA